MATVKREFDDKVSRWLVLARALHSTARTPLIGVK
jgi:hypothetical protein